MKKAKKPETYKCCGGQKSRGHKKACRYYTPPRTDGGYTPTLSKEDERPAQTVLTFPGDKDIPMTEGEQSSDPTAKTAEDSQAKTVTATRNSSESRCTVQSLKAEYSFSRMERPGGLARKLRGGGGQDNAPHLIVQARAGTGKTTTIVEALRRLFDDWNCKSCNGKGKLLFSQEPTVRPCEDCKGEGQFKPLVPSKQQEAIWKCIEQSKGLAKTVCFVAFNSSIATELKWRVPKGCDAMTLHAMGFKAIRNVFDLNSGDDSVDKYRVHKIIAEILDTPLAQLQLNQTEFLEATVELVSLCKQNLVDGSEEELDGIVEHHDISLNGKRDKVYDLIPRILKRCRNVTKDRCVDYDDMVWLPLQLSLLLVKYDLLLVDESQDLNRAQQCLAKRAGKRLVFVGDDKQAIYGFAGADSESMERLEKELSRTDPVTSGVNIVLSNDGRGCKKLPLTITYRCSQAVVRESQKTVPDIEAHPDNPEGKVNYLDFKDAQKRLDPTWLERVQDGDMVICRCNGPLVSQCFRFLKMGKRAYIQGRDVMAGLIKLIKKMKANDVPELVGKLANWSIDQKAKENAKPHPSESKLLAIKDKYDCIICFAEEANSVEGLIKKIESLFSDDTRAGIRLSSIHKAKGLEAPNIFFLMPEGAQCPHPMAKLDWERGQEEHLLYVGQTRARLELNYVS